MSPNKFKCHSTKCHHSKMFYMITVLLLPIVLKNITYPPYEISIPYFEWC